MHIFEFKKKLRIIVTSGNSLCYFWNFTEKYKIDFLGTKYVLCVLLFAP